MIKKFSMIAIICMVMLIQNTTFVSAKTNTDYETISLQ